MEVDYQKFLVAFANFLRGKSPYGYPGIDADHKKAELLAREVDKLASEINTAAPIREIRIKKSLLGGNVEISAVSNEYRG
jgi:hypothetical protein